MGRRGKRAKRAFRSSLEHMTGLPMKLWARVQAFGTNRDAAAAAREWLKGKCLACYLVSKATAP